MRFVVKNGSNTFCNCSCGMPVPSSTTCTTTYCPSGTVTRSRIKGAFNILRSVVILISPPAGIASRAFTTRFIKTCSSCRLSARIRCTTGSWLSVRVTFSPTKRFSRCVRSARVSRMSSVSGRSVCLRENASNCPTKAAARLAFWLICTRSL